jgi:CelD/BcsL family acetyltransferase involved in cellulose biosynthesis
MKLLGAAGRNCERGMQRSVLSTVSGLKLEVGHGFEAALGDEGTGALITRPEWDTLLLHAASNVVFLTWQWQQSWWRHFGGSAGCKLHLLVLRAERGATVGVAPLFIAREPLPPAKPYVPGELRPEPAGKPVRVVQFVGGIDIADYLDVIASPEHLEPVWAAALDYLLDIRDQWDAIDFHSLPQFSPSRDILKRLGADRGLRFEVLAEDACPVLDLPSGWETYLMSLRKKDRHELRRKVRKLEGRDDVHWYLVPPSNHKELEEKMRVFVTLHKQSGTDKAAFMDAQMESYFLDMARDLADTGWLDLAILEVDQEPASAYLSFRYNDRLYLYNSGYSPRFASYSAGVALLAYRIHKAILQGVRCFDFLRGDEPYKYDFGAKDTYVYRALYKE